MTHCSHYTEICSYVLRPRSFGGVCIPGYRCGISAIRADIALRTRIAERERPHVNTNEATNTAGARGVAGPGPGSRRVRPCGTGRDTVTDERVREFAYEARLPYVIIVNSILAKNDYLRYERGQSLLFLRHVTSIWLAHGTAWRDCLPCRNSGHARGAHGAGAHTRAPAITL